jgi:hypothetical protein
MAKGRENKEKTLPAGSFGSGLPFFADNPESLFTLVTIAFWLGLL